MLALCVGPSRASAAISVVEVSNVRTFNPGTSFTYALFFPAATNRYLLVAVELGGLCTSTMPAITGITYRGVAMTRITSVVGTPCGANGTRSEQWGLVAPLTGAGNIIISFASPVQYTLHSQAVAFAGVDPTNPVRAFASGSGMGTSSSVTVSSAPGDVVVNTVGQARNILAPGNCQQQHVIANHTQSYTLDSSGLSTATAAASPVTMTWAFGPDGSWQSISTSLAPAVVPPSGAPAVTTGNISALTSSGATLNGRLNPNLGASTGWFRYSTTQPSACDDTFGTRVPDTGGSDVCAGSAEVAFSQTLTTLEPETTYYYCALANNSGGLSTSSVMPFTTLALEPFVPGYRFRRAVDVVGSKVVQGPHMNFPARLCVTLPELRTTANGGEVTDPEGDDIIFTSSDGSTPLAHEVESFDPVTGALVAWVRLPLLETSSRVFLYYGNPAVTTFQGSVASGGVDGVWDSNFRGVWHLNETSGTVIVDSSRYANVGNKRTATEPSAAAGQLSGGQSFDGVNDYASFGDIGGVSTLGMSVAFWANYAALPPGWAGPIAKGPSGATNGFQYAIGATGGTDYDIALNTSDVTGQTNGLCKWPLAGLEGSWHHFAFTWSAAAGWCRLYIDGVLIADRNATILMNPNNNFALDMGRAYSGAYANVSLDEVHISDVARSAGWLATEHQNQLSCATFFAVGAQTPAPSPPDAGWPDAGPAPEARRLRVECGCGTFAGGWLGLGILTVLVAINRRARSRGAL